MSRTYRNLPVNGRFFRKPKTMRERKIINSLYYNEDLKQFGIYPRNREKRYIPNYWDDIYISAYLEVFHKKKEFNISLFDPVFRVNLFLIEDFNKFIKDKYNL